MRIVVEIPLAEWLASLNDADHAQRAEHFLASQMNELIDVADRRLAAAPATPALRRARDVAARSVLDRDRGALELEIAGTRITTADVSLAGLRELEGPIARDAVRTFRRAARRPFASDVSPATST